MPSSELVAAANQARPEAEKTVQDWVEEYADQFERALASEVQTDHFVRGILTTITANADLRRVTPRSLIAACLFGAQLQLEIGNGLNQFHLTPRQVTVRSVDERGRKVERKEWVCVPIIGYQGYVVLAYRSGRVVDIQRVIVRDGDEFDYGYTTERGIAITWKPSLPIDPSKALTGVVMRSKMVGGGVAETYLSRAEIERRRPAYTKEQQGERGPYVPNTPWKTDYDAMSLKTVAREHTKFLPKSTQVERAMAFDGRVLANQDGEVAPALNLQDEFDGSEPE